MPGWLKFQKVLLKRGKKWCRKGLLDTQLAGAWPPPLLSLAAYKRDFSIDSKREVTEKICLEGLLELIHDTGGVLSVLNDRRYGILSCAYRSPPFIVYLWLKSRFKSIIDWNVPYPVDGRTVWMVAVECLFSGSFVFLENHFPEIDLELPDNQGHNPSRIIRMSASERTEMVVKAFRSCSTRYPPEGWSNEECNREHQWAVNTLELVYHKMLPMYKNGLKALLLAQLHNGPRQLLLIPLVRIIGEFLRLE